MIELVVFSFLLGIKILLIGTDPSTDFEVHRNWKAITNTLPIDKWYFDETSDWTLDYPPMFAYMEYILGYISKFFDAEITRLDNLYYKAFSCILYQRLTVILGDFLLLFSIKRLGCALNLSKTNLVYSIILIQGFTGLIIVDNMHFQYNTVLMAVFLYSVSLIFSGDFIYGAIVFSVLLNLKHIFIYMAPAYFVYYLKYYVLKDKSLHIINFIKLAISIVSVFLISFSPFIYYSIRDGNIEQFLQILRRLFPFKRGLLHAYWAPNFWAIYSFLDKSLFFFLPRSDTQVRQFNMSSQGLNQDISFDVLPDVSTKFANLVIIGLSLTFILKSLIYDKYETEIKRQRSVFLNYLITSSLIFFNFGFQVHEKAFIKVSLLGLLFYMNKINENKNNLRTDKIYLFLLITVGIFAQMPLIHTVKDYFIKLCLVFAYIIIAKIFLNKNEDSNKQYDFINFLINIYILITVILDFIVVVSPNIDMKDFLNSGDNKWFIFLSSLKERYQFLPLMLFSVINSVVVQIIIFMTLFLIKID